MSHPTNSSPVTSAVQELRQSKSLVEQVTEALKTQQTILKQRGLNLPPMVLSSLAAIQRDMGTLESTLVQEQMELGQLRALTQLSTEIYHSLDVDTVLEQALDIVIALTRAERGYLITVDPQSGERNFRVSRDNTLKPGQEQAGTDADISTTILNKVIETREPLLADNAFQDERLQGGASIANLNLRSVLCVPLTYKDEMLGVVYVDNRLQSGIFSERELNTLTTFANAAAVAIANARLYQQDEEVLAERAQMKELMDNVFTSLVSGVVATNAADKITLFNPSAERVLELPAQEMMGSSLDHVLERVSSDLKEPLKAVHKQHTVQEVETEHISEDGQQRALSMKISPLKDAQEQAQGIAVVVDDITEKRKHEQQIRLLKTYLPEEMVDKIHEISQLTYYKESERRTVSCLFAEVRPLKVLKSDVQGEDPLHMMSLLNEFLQEATLCIMEQKGLIDKYVGNDVMALWNTQLNAPTNPLTGQQEIHAYLAIECALQMRERITQLCQRLPQEYPHFDPNPHYYRIGINSGVATLGNVGSLTRRDFTAIGDTINLAKRLEENTVEGQIFVSEDTLNSLNESGVEHNFRFEERDPIQVKGRSTETRIYEVFRDHA